MASFTDRQGTRRRRGNAAGVRVAFAAALWLAASPVEARPVCMVVASTSGSILHEDGDCRTRVTPASTFKLALSLIGFESGFLTDAHDPVLTYQKGDPDWGGAAWTRPNDPESWLRHSVVWYSQRIARATGSEQLTRYAQSFGYGNADFSGDPGQDNGLERSWIASSLKISPVEQVLFLGKLVERRLPVAASAIDKTIAITESQAIAGWTISGKTGSAYPRKADRSFDRARAWGWYVGWAERDDRTLIFARLDQDETRQKVSSGLRARDALLAEWEAIVGVLPQ
ncbi:MAG: class D beta-lactamase [Hoeflea sp.]|uniref:class D beta-lactamase n=1 Tax=Hoeflea sp. TaxID=1940281 RepID=UPI002731410F|nr:class D beta-lactamase [Hoeflea sp.]MDP2119757.1 class D beta-lactamase [Hoeflea sp.]